MKSIFVLVLFILVILFSSTRADYHYASHEGSNEYPYTSWETATDSIKYAIAAADPGDTVYIGAGEYYERVVTAPPDSNLAVIGAGMDSTTWWWDVPGQRAFWCGDNMLVKNIHFYHTVGPGTIDSGDHNSIRVEYCLFTQAAKILTFGHGHIVLENCVFIPNSGGAIEVMGGASKAEIRNCLVEYGLFAGVAFFDINADTIIVENNIVTNSTSFLSLLDHDTSIVRNNLVYNDIRPWWGGCWNCPTVSASTFDNFRRSFTNPAEAILIADSGSFDYRNNSFSRMTTAIQFWDYEPSWVIPAQYSNLWQVDSLGMMAPYPVHWDTVDIQWLDPMFVGAWDYHLQAYSPLIDTGDPDIYDVDGTRSDIGAYGGPVGESYEYLDLPPRVPDSLSATIFSDSIILNWRFNTEADFNRYQIHRETYSGFEPSLFNLIAEPDTSYYVDTDWTPENNYYYRIAAVDDQDNMSDYSEELAVILTGTDGAFGAEMPTITAIKSNYPNPFNSKTTIIYTVANLGPIPAQINIDIFDIMGRKVRTLVDERKNVGIHRIIWDGQNDNGLDCPSGVYFARITQWKVDYMKRHQKLVLLR